MPVVNSTPQKELTSCDALSGAGFTTSVSGCDIILTNTATVTGITNIKYEAFLGATLVDTINTTSTNYTWDAASLYYGETVSVKQTVTSASGTFTKTQNVAVPSSLSSCVFEFSSNLAGASTFDPETVVGSGTTLWRTPDDTYIRNVIPSVVGSTVGFDGTTHTIYVRPTNGLAGLSLIDISGEGVLGAVDFGVLTSTTTIRVGNNSGITAVDVSACTALEELRVESCSLTALDVSGLANMEALIFNSNTSLSTLTLETTANYLTLTGNNTAIVTLNLSGITFAANASLEFSNITALTGITMPSATSTILFWSFNNCANLSGTPLDLTWANFGTGTAQVRHQSNTSITGIDHTGRSGELDRYLVSGSGFTGAVDLSMFTYGTNMIYRFDSTGITSLSLNLTAGANITNLWINGTSIGVQALGNNTLNAAAEMRYNNMSLTAAEVNENLVNLDNASFGPGASGTILIDGTNAAPDGTSGGFDGLTAKSNLIADGYTVTTN